LGVVAMVASILAILTLPFVDLGKSRGFEFRFLSKFFFIVFVANFVILMILGAKHVEDPFILLGQISTAVYFANFIIILPIVSLIENTLIDLSTTKTI
jgi:ubiquinol-cytochrome c reductase cytochrome b subunit